MRSNVFIIFTALLGFIFMMSACPAAPPQETNAVNQSNQPVQNAPANRNNQIGQNNSNPNAPNAGKQENLSALPPNANVGNRPVVAMTPPAAKNELTTVTLENYKKITIGMSYEEVVAIMGSKGEILSNDIPVGGEKSGLYKWSAKGGEIQISGLFQNGRLLTKNQVGLAK